MKKLEFNIAQFWYYSRAKSSTFKYLKNCIYENSANPDPTLQKNEVPDSKKIFLPPFGATSSAFFIKEKNMD